jgi:hypothetical protein
MPKRPDEKAAGGRSEKAPVTQRYYVPADDDAPTVPVQQRPAPAPGIEVEYRMAGPGPRDRTMVEIWTKNRIYRVDPTMTCHEVVDRSTGKSDPDLRLVGSQLSGGQTRRPDDDVVDLYFPFPVPGSSAFFSDRKSMKVLGRTTAVERVVLCLYKMRVREGELDLRADSRTGRFRAR